MGVKVYGIPQSSNTIRVLAALNEKGVEFELVLIQLLEQAHRHPTFLALNPFGQIPAFEDGDVLLYESRAINRYIVTKYAETGPDLLLSGGTPAERAAVEQWLEVESQQYGPPIRSLVFEARIKPRLGGAADAAVVEAQTAKLEKVLDVYEARLSWSKYLAGGQFTLADLNHMPYTHYLMKTAKAGLVTSRPHVLAWWQDISSRPAWKKTAAIMPA